eukprot:TRINITY_DN46313_c0_g1_i1.p1 TRINITY_DN46313_c0_g1~~TRINITY_DN46313_c0_g1_i1.p1  ORF type:complete len:203 (-),score=38.50 TRINITY_DN46313_c0_g1_i1:174-782(-)
MCIRDSTGGAHPFGKRSVRQHNICQNKSNLNHLRKLPLAADLVERCVQHESSRRPTAAAVCAHPLFWDARKTLTFLQEASDRLDVEEQDSVMILAVEAFAKPIFGKNWHSKLDNLATEEMASHRKYRHGSVCDLLRVIRNKAHHWRSLPAEVSELMGPMPEGFVRYFTSRFPALLISVFRVLEERCSDEPALEAFWGSQPKS